MTELVSELPISNFILQKVDTIFHLYPQKFSVFAEQGLSFEDWLSIEFCVSLFNDPAIQPDDVHCVPPVDLLSIAAPQGPLRHCQNLTFKMVNSNQLVGIRIKIAHTPIEDHHFHTCLQAQQHLCAGQMDENFLLLVVATTLSVAEFEYNHDWQVWLSRIFSQRTSYQKLSFDNADKGSVHAFLIAKENEPAKSIRFRTNHSLVE